MRKIAGLLIIILLTVTGYSQEHKVSVDEFLKETQKGVDEQGRISLNWWIPVEFWEISLRNNPGMTNAQIEELLSVFDQYCIFAIVDGEVGPFGGITYTELETIAKDISFIGQDNKKYTPLKESQISSDLKNMLDIFKPMLKNMIGEMGENMHFFVFNDIVKGERIADPLKKEGLITLSYQGKSITWETPLGSLLPPKKCPEDGEPMNGGWKFCPYHGKELVEFKEEE